MVNSRTRQLDETFYALSDPTRRAIVVRLSAGKATVGELGQPFDISPPALTKHLRVLERVGLITQQRVGRTRHCELQPAPLREAMAFLQHYAAFWDARLDRLGAYIETTLEEKT